MKKLLKIVLSCGIFLPLFFSSCSSVGKTDIDSKDNYVPVEIIENLNYMNTNISYPDFLDFPELSDKIEHTLQHDWNNFKTYAENTWQEGNFPFEYNAKSEITYSGNIISVKTEIYSYSGGNHGETIIETFNFDTVDKKFLNVSEVSGYTYEEIAAFSKAAFADVLMYDEAVTPNPENFQHFTVNGNEIIIYFEQLEVAPYSEGVQKVIINKK